MTNLVAAIVMLASWEKFDDAGKIAANGHAFNPASMSCATRRWPLGTVLIVQDIHNGCSVQVIVTDRPARKYADRIDLSPAAFQRLNGLALGVCQVTAQNLSSSVLIPDLRARR